MASSLYMRGRASPLVVGHAALSVFCGRAASLIAPPLTEAEAPGALAFTKYISSSEGHGAPANATEEDNIISVPCKATCAVGTTCGPSGGCIPAGFAAHDVCVDPKDDACISLVSDVTEASRSWLLVLTSTGGSGHLVAAKNLGDAWQSSEWQNTMQAARTSLDQNKKLLTDTGYGALSASLDQAKLTAPVETINIMESPCMAVPGVEGQRVGKLFTGVWNMQQSLGDVKALNKMQEQQGTVDTFLAPGCYKYMRAIFQGITLNRRGSPSKIISCQPMHLLSITKALADIQYEQPPAVPMVLDLWITELPTNGSTAFFNPLQDVVKNDWFASQNVRLHVVEPQGGIDFVSSRTGLDESQIVIEDYGPLPAMFKDRSMPRPNTDYNLVLSCDLPAEAHFYKSRTKSFAITKDDFVTLVSLGSQPTSSAIMGYIKNFETLNPPKSGMHYVFLGTGDFAQNEYKRLFEKAFQEANLFNKKQQAAHGRIRIVPFTKQPIQMLMGRADLIIARSGGMTCFEILALARRAHRTVMMHVEMRSEPRSLGHMVAIPGHPAVSIGHFETIAAQEGLLTWERGNAEYLSQRIGARLVTPSLLEGTMWNRIEAMYAHRSSPTNKKPPSK